MSIHATMMETEEVSITASILRFSADDEGLGFAPGRGFLGDANHYAPG